MLSVGFLISICITCAQHKSRIGSIIPRSRRSGGRVGVRGKSAVGRVGSVLPRVVTGTGTGSGRRIPTHGYLCPTHFIAA